MDIIKANQDTTLTEIENQYIETLMASNEDVAIEISGAQAEKMDLESDDE